MIAEPRHLPPVESQISVDDAFDLLRGIAALTGSGLVGDIARTLARHPQAPLSNALNHKQVASKLWLVEAVGRSLPGRIGHVLIVGGWIGALSAMLLERLGDRIGSVTSLDIDPACRPVAETLNAKALAAGRFQAVTEDMHRADLYRLAAGRPAIDLVINTSTEHIPDVRSWLDQLPAGMAVVLQSNDYFSIPEHVSSVPDLAAFKAKARLGQVLLAEALPLERYTRFMLIGRV